MGFPTYMEVRLKDIKEPEEDKTIGCDIHIYPEIYNDNIERWVYTPSYGVTEIDNRNYTLFAALAGVRGSGPKPNGLPEDLSDTVQYQWDTIWQWDGHSCFHMSLTKFIDVFKATTFDIRLIADLSLRPKDSLSKEHKRLLDTYENFIDWTFEDIREDDRNNCRLVCWFDN